VDAYAVVKQNRLRYLRLNKKNLCANLYQGLQDAIIVGDKITLLPLDRGSLCHLLSHEVHITWFKIIKMP
jgi:hypothetical protein